MVIVKATSTQLADQLNPGPGAMGWASLGIIYSASGVGVLSFSQDLRVERQTVMD